MVNDQQQLQLTKRFPTIKDAYRWLVSLASTGISMQMCRLAEDRFASTHPNREPNRTMFRLLGVTPSVERTVRKISPQGEWALALVPPGHSYEKVGLLGSHVAKTAYHRASLYYSRFLPYAVAMMQAEEDFTCDGIDFNSVNSMFGTCYGFERIANNELADTNDRVIDVEDSKLFNQLNDISASYCHPSFPFTAMFLPCAAFVAIQAPKLFAKLMRGRSSTFLDILLQEYRDGGAKTIPDNLIR